MTELAGWSPVEELARDVRRGTVGAEELARESLARIERLDPLLRAFQRVDAEGALARARGIDRARASGRELGPLAGVPVALKDNMCLAGSEVTAGSRILEGWRAPYTATFVERLLAAGAVPLGATRMDEFAMGSSGENCAFGAARNPWDPARAPGGSSSGSAVAVAAGMVPLALGSDTGGSVRQPASFCGVSGLRPTWGRVSRFGLIAFGSSLDQVGPIATRARDLELALAAISGVDPRDPTTLAEPPLDASGGEPADLAGLRVGVAEGALSGEVEPAVRASVERALEVLVEHGARAVPVELPHARHAIAAYYVLATAEASSNLARYDGVRYGLRRPGDGSLLGMMAATRDEGFGAEVKRRILLGTYALSAGYHDAWYGSALAVRARLARDFARAFEVADVLVGPTSPTVAFPLGERVDDPVAMYRADLFTVPASLGGLPAVSVPASPAEVGGLPVGLQITGPRGADGRVLACARAFQSVTTHHRRRPAPPDPSLAPGSEAR